MNHRLFENGCQLAYVYIENDTEDYHLFLAPSYSVHPDERVIVDTITGEKRGVVLDTYNLGSYEYSFFEFMMANSKDPLPLRRILRKVSETELNYPGEDLD